MSFTPARSLIATLAAFGLLASLFSPTGRALAADSAYVQVGVAKTKKTAIAFPETKAVGGGKATSLAKIVTDTVNNDLSFMDLFKFLSSSAFLEKNGGLTPESFKITDWNGIGADVLIKAGLTIEGNSITLEGYVYDIPGSKQILAKRYIATANDARTLGHTFANNIVESLTGLPGIFLTKIAMSCDRTGKKEIYVMDFDGTDVKQITSHRSTAIGPAWSPDGTRVAYSLYSKHRNNVKNLDLFEFNFANSTYRLLSNKKGMNSGAAYSPDGSKIALTMSFKGNPEIFLYDPVTSSVTPLTKSFGLDVDPAWSPDGKQIAFVSNRPGMPMIYSMNADGSKVQRLTFAGHYNATPTWSPQNNKIGFAGDLDGRFDIFIMNPDGTNIERLTKGAGNNEDPHFSPDGNFLVFSSNRTGQANIYVMNVEGSFVRRLTFGMGACVSPKWSAPPRKK